MVRHSANKFVIVRNYYEHGRGGRGQAVRPSRVRGCRLAVPDKRASPIARRGQDATRRDATQVLAMPDKPSSLLLVIRRRQRGSASLPLHRSTCTCRRSAGQGQDRAPRGAAYSTENTAMHCSVHCEKKSQIYDNPLENLFPTCSRKFAKKCRKILYFTITFPAKSRRKFILRHFS